MTSEIDIRYIAGFFDAEGYVGVKYSKITGGHGFHVTLTNNHKTVLEEIQTIFEGSLIAPKSYGLKHGKEAWVLSLYSSKAMKLLKAVQPYLVIKRDQVDLALTFPLGKISTPVTDEVRQKRQMIMDRLKEMKHSYKEVPIDWTSTIKKLEDNPKVKQAVELYQGGMETQEVSETVGAKYDTVLYWMRTLGINRSRQEVGERAGQKRKDGIDKNPEAHRAAKLFDQGLSIAEVAKEVGEKYATVFYWLKKLGRHRTLEEGQQIRRQREADQNPPKPPKPKKVPLPERPDVIRAAELRDDGLSYQKIAGIISQEFDKKCTHSHVGYWFQQLGIAQTNNDNDDEIKEITRLYVEEEMSLRQVAGHVERSLSFVQRRVRDAGLTRGLSEAKELR